MSLPHEKETDIDRKCLVDTWYRGLVLLPHEKETDIDRKCQTDSLYCVSVSLPHEKETTLTESVLLIHCIVDWCHFLMRKRLTSTESV